MKRAREGEHIEQMLIKMSQGFCLVLKSGKMLERNKDIFKEP